MSLQFSFGFEPPRRPATNKLLILAKPDEQTATRIARTADDLAACLGFKGRLVRPELLHFTIHPIALLSEVPDR